MNKQERYDRHAKVVEQAVEDLYRSDDYHYERPRVVHSLRPSGEIEVWVGGEGGGRYVLRVTVDEEVG